MIFPKLETNRLILREFRNNDVEAVYDIFSQDIVTEHYILETMKSFEPAEDLVRNRISLFEKWIGTRWAITLKGGSDRAIGSCGYYSPNTAFHSIEIGYDLHPDYWRQGFMTEALTAIISFCYGEDFLFHLNRIRALTEMDNIASKALLCKLGFVEEGILREYGYWKDQYHDVRVFSLLRRDWTAKIGKASKGKG
jgi:ribosomal-protein-alanine N-acetyltransferase